MKRLWQEAASFASRAHRGQKRDDGGTPYFAHPTRVAMTVRDVFDCDDEVCLAAAFLHDVIEDTPADYDDILDRFGEDVARCVAALTKNMSLPEALRERAYDEGLAAADWRAKLVKLADTYDNFCDIKSNTKRDKALSRCRRAIDLARLAMSEHPAIGRAIAAIEELIAD